jgi:hypothetical protein
MQSRVVILGIAHHHQFFVNFMKIVRFLAKKIIVHQKILYNVFTKECERVKRQVPLSNLNGVPH